MDIHTALTPLKATVGALALAMGMAVQAADPVGHWEGEIEIPNQPLVVKIDLRQDGGDWHGTIDIPAQGASTLPLDVAKVEQTQSSSASWGVPGNPTFAGREANGVIRRVFSQGVAKLDFQPLGTRFRDRVGRRSQNRRLRTASRRPSRRRC